MPKGTGGLAPNNAQAERLLKMGLNTETPDLGKIVPDEASKMDS